jgi:ketosteroid isomerase-like protein
MLTRRTIAAGLLAAVPAAVAARELPAGEADAARHAILAVVARMQAAWNRGDFRGYMAGFENPGVTFVSGGRIQAGWQGTLDHYVRDYGASAETRGRLRFFDMTVDLLCGDAAMLVGSFQLTRPQHSLQGINTRLFRKEGGRWVIAMNHVSSYETDAAAS